MQNKRGQIFLIAALVVVALLIGLAVVNNYATSPPEATYLFDLSKEIAYEGGQVVNQGVFAGLTQPEIDQRINGLVEEYHAQQDEDTDFLVLYGDAETLHINSTYYTCEETGSVGIGTAAVTPCTKKGIPLATEVDSDTQTIKIKFPNSQAAPFTMQIKKGQSFYVVVRTVKREGTFVG